MNGASSNVPGFNALNSGTAQIFNLSDIKTFGANKVNELRLNFMRNAFNIAIPKGGLGPKLSSLGFVEGAQRHCQHRTRRGSYADRIQLFRPSDP